jgi:L-amino acid N-acyltransferase YncA
MNVRLAQASDAEQIVAIYAPFVTDMPTTFETVVPSIAEMQSRISRTLETLPWLVCAHNQQIAGYAYASPHRSRSAYQWSVDVSVYITPDFRRRGIARNLYQKIFKMLAVQGYYNAFAGITLPNLSSVALHESLEFKSVGICCNVGFKLGAWRDVGWWQLTLQPYSAEPPNPLRPLPEILAETEFFFQ